VCADLYCQLAYVHVLRGKGVMASVCTSSGKAINDEHRTVRLYGALWDIFVAAALECFVFCCEYLHFSTGVQISMCAYLMLRQVAVARLYSIYMLKWHQRLCQNPLEGCTDCRASNSPQDVTCISTTDSVYVSYYCIMLVDLLPHLPDSHT